MPNETFTKPSIKLLQRYFRDDPITAAHNIEDLEEEDAVLLLERLSPTVSTRVFTHLRPSYAARLVKSLQPSTLSDLLERGGADFAASVLLSLPEDERKPFIEQLPLNIRNTAQEILTFPVGSAGSQMKTDYTCFQSHMTVQEAVRKLKTTYRNKKPKSNIYIIDESHRLIGVLGLRDLIVSDSNITLQELMTPEVVSVEPFSDMDEVAKVLTKHKFISIPVVDAQKRLMGVVRAAQFIANAEEQATQDIQKLFGASAEERAFSPVSFCLWKRLPWLHVNLLTAFMAASVVALFEGIIAQITILAVFLPVVAGQGGNAGAQSLAVVMRGIILREIPQQEIKRLITKEATIGLVNGLVVGFVTGLIAWLWHGNPYLGLVIGLAMIVNLTAAGLAGAGIPVLMKRYGFDPAQSSSIILTTVTDVIGFFAFLGFAVIFKSFLL